MGTKRYMNDKGEIRDYGFCMGVACCECPNDRSKNGFDESCNKYMDRDSVKWHKNLGWREIFELENYTDKWCVMVCANDSQSEMFAKFLDKNGMKWRDGHSYIDDQCWRSTNDVGTGFVFNQGIQCYPGCWSDFDEIVVLHFEDYVFKMEDNITYEKENKTMEKVTKNDHINGRTIKDFIRDGMLLVTRDGSLYLADTLYTGGIYIMTKYTTIKLSNYKKDMIYDGSAHGNDIMKIYSRPKTPVCRETICDFSRGDRELLWERDEATPMTQEQIEAALGYKVKIKED